MLAPPNIPRLLDTQYRQGSERLPTPIYGHFNDIDVNMDMHGAAVRPSTLLSPFIREEEEASWWRGHCLPSPADTPDEFMTPVSPADGTMDRLHADTAGGNETACNETPFPALPSHEQSILEGLSENFGTELEAPRSRRLVMGVRGDCDNCTRKVPGHYSHIVYA
jgi:hypothetical protein